MKKILTIAFMMILMSSMAYSYTYEYDCGINSTSLSLHWADSCWDCGDVGIDVDIIMIEVFDNDSDALSCITNIYNNPPYSSGWDARTSISNDETWNGNCRTNSEIMWDKAIWNDYRFVVWNCNASSKYGKLVYVLYKDTEWVDENNDCVNDNDDEDLDGIPDDQDPYPLEDRADCRYRYYAESYCDGVLVGYGIETNYGDEIWYGEDAGLSCEGTTTTKLFLSYIKSYPYACSQLGDTGVENYDNLALQYGAVNTVAQSAGAVSYNSDGSLDVDAEDTDVGSTGVSSETETELLAKITNNTETLLDAANQGNDISLGTQQILGNIIAQNTAQSRQTGVLNQTINTGVTNITSSVNNVKTATDAVKTSTDGVKNSVDDVKTEIEDGNTVDSGTQTKINSIESYNPSNDFAESEYQSSEVPEENLLTDIMNAFIENNPLNDLFDDIQITSSTPTCSFSDTLTIGSISEEVEFSLCEYEDIFELMGNILYFCVIIAYIFIIFS